MKIDILLMVLIIMSCVVLILIMINNRYHNKRIKHYLEELEKIGKKDKIKNEN